MYTDLYFLDKNYVNNAIFRKSLCDNKHDQRVQYEID